MCILGGLGSMAKGIRYIAEGLAIIAAGLHNTSRRLGQTGETLNCNIYNTLDDMAEHIICIKRGLE
jgi:hypothetical protein